MLYLNKFIAPLSVIVALTILFPKDALAYLDPGTGSLIIQTIVAIFFGALLTAKIYWSKIKAFFNKDDKTSEEE